MLVFRKLVRGVSKLKGCSFESIKPLCTSSVFRIKVAVCGSSGGVGQPLSLLLKMSPHIDDLTLYDLKECPGMAADLSHINTKARVKCFTKATSLPEALEKKDIIIIAGGKSRTGGSGMVRSDLFDENVKFVGSVVESMSKTAPEAMLCIMTNPINCLMPVAAGILTKAKVYNPKKLFGITTIDCVRASTFAAELLCLDPTQLAIPVIGGHSAQTIVPVFSQASTPIDLPKDKMLALIERVQRGGDEVLEAKEKDASTLASAYAGARFVFALCRALNGEKFIIECAMVQSEITDANFFANPLVLDHKGVNKNLGYGKLTKDECCLLSTAVKQLITDIDKGKMYLENDGKDEKEKQKVKKKELPKEIEKGKSKVINK